MTKRSKTKDPEIGSIVEIPLPNGRKGYARVLKNPLMAFYAVQSERPLSPAEILRQPVAFKVWVMNSAISSGRWSVIGHAPLETDLERTPWFFKQDAISKALSLYQNGIERAATKEECVGLERAAVWSAQHIESRLEDHLEGRTNKWLDAMKIKA
jgi:hypothetical protein